MPDVLLKHQIEGGDWIANRPLAICADEPGAGKTATAVRACDVMQAKRILVLPPSAVKEHWAREFLRWSTVDRKITVLPGHPREVPGEGVTIASHAALVKPGHAYMLGAVLWDEIILDEGHMFRSFTAARTYRLFGQEESCLWRRSRHMTNLTGTPIVNGAADLYPVLSGPGKIGWDWYPFAQTFAENIISGMGGDLVARGVKNHQQFADALRPILMRRTLAGLGIHLPPLDVPTVEVQIKPADLVGVTEILHRWTPDTLSAALKDRDEVQDKDISRARHALGLAKVNAIADGIRWMLGQGGDESPVVVFYQHTAVRDALRAALADSQAQMSWIAGDITRAQLTAAEQWFQAGKIDVLFVQNDAGGMGLTLTHGCRVVVAELPWTAAQLWQMIKRVHRMTQTRAVTARVVFAAGCWLEQTLLGVVRRKHAAAEKLMNLLTAPAVEHV